MAKRLRAESDVSLVSYSVQGRQGSGQERNMKHAKRVHSALASLLPPVDVLWFFVTLDLSTSVD